MNTERDSRDIHAITRHTTTSEVLGLGIVDDCFGIDFLDELDVRPLKNNLKTNYIYMNIILIIHTLH